MKLRSIRKRSTLSFAIMSCVLILICFLPAAAQEELTRPKAEARVTIGASGFLGDDDELIGHGVGGASVRIYVTRRISIEPEFLYMRNSPNDEDYLGQLSVAYDFGDGTKRIVPYMVAGGGVLHHRGRFYGADFVTGQPRVFEQSGNTASFSGGGGVKIFVTRGLFIAPEARVGWEPAVRATVSIGYVFSGRRKR